ncbi:MAG: radical SAM protein [Polyangiaceae bacterium]
MLRSPLLAFTSLEAAQRIKAWKVDTVLVPMLSAHPQVHDRVAGAESALVKSLMGMRAAAEAGLRIEIEVPLLSSRLQRLPDIVDLARRAVGRVAAVHFYVPTKAPTAALDPGSWAELQPRIAQALSHCRSTATLAVIHPRSGIPLCAQLAAGVTDATRQSRGPTPEVHYAKGTPCDSCRASAQCFGVRQWQYERHGLDGLTPLTRLTTQLRKESNQPRRQWTDAQRRAAQRTNWLIMRVTVNCSQDCVFCSVSEYSRQRWEDPASSYRAIARAARRGVQRVHFTGGEPTLSPHLADFVDVARRCGIPEIDISTNAISLTNRRRADRLVQAGLTHAFVSLHAHDEALSRELTQKQGDFERTTRGIDMLLERDVQVSINHVINARNYRYLPRYVEFLRERFAGKVLLSLAMVTPQYRALENFSLIPKLSEVSPFLMRAAWRCLEIDQPFYIGAKQGTPPCFLGPFQAWTDLVSVEDEAVAEDADQKVRDAACDDCRYSKHCTGIWRPYAERHGTSELQPVPGPPVRASDFWGGKSQGHVLDVFPRSFSEVPETLRDRAAEARVRALVSTPPEAIAAEPKRLPVLQVAHHRPKRVLLFGSSGQARRLASALSRVSGLVLDSVVAPHMDDDLARAFDAGGWRDADAALDTTTPDAVVIACATRAHHDLVERVAARGIPMLVEKPVGESLEETQAVAALAQSGAKIVPAHNLLHAPGMLDFLAIEAKRTEFARRVPEHGQDAAGAWDRQLLGELFYHALVVTTRGLGSYPDIVSTRYRDSERPRWLEFELAGGGQQILLTFDYVAEKDELELIRETPAGTSHRWLRSGSMTSRGERTDTWDMRPVQGSGDERTNMLTHFRDVIAGVSEPVASVADALLIKATVKRMLDALQTSGVAYQRKHAPMRIATRELLPRAFK